MRLSAAFNAIWSKATIAILVVFGLLMIPVECSVAMGPHTLFISADAVAALQDGALPSGSGHGAHVAPEQAPSHTAAAATTSRAKHQHAAPHASHSGADQAPERDSAAITSDAVCVAGGPVQASHAPARPAGISADAVVALDLPGGHPALLGVTNDTHPRFVCAMPPDRLLAGPEPPPP
jgi:hypothetical protein